MKFNIRVDDSGLQILRGGQLQRVVQKVAGMAGGDGLRAMNAATNRRIRERKAIKLQALRKGRRGAPPIKPIYPTNKQAKQMRWVLGISGEVAPIISYPARQTKTGVVVTINQGRPVRLAHAFIAKMKSGHVGVFERYGARSYAPMVGHYKGHDRYRGQRRQAIREMYTSRLVDPILDRGAADEIQERGRMVFQATWSRMFPLELGRAVLAATRSRPAS